MKLYVEILPDYWPEWRRIPLGAKIGRVTKRRPKDHRDFVEVDIKVDEVVRWHPKRGVTVS